MGNVPVFYSSGNRNCSGKLTSSNSRNLQDVKKRKGISGVDYRYNKRIGASPNSNSSRLFPFLPSTNRIQKNPIFRGLNVKALSIPFTTISTLLLSGIFTRDYAAATYSATPLSHPTPIVSTNNTSFSLASLNPFSSINGFFDKASQWIDDLPSKITDMSVELMAKTYELCTSLILKTPLWIFDNEWFKNTTYQFSMFTISIVTVLTALEGIKRMFSGARKNKGKTMEMKEIMKRWSLVSLVLTSVPFIFQKSFQALNYVSEKVISMGVNTMQSVASPDVVSGFDVLTLLIFNIVLIATVIPVLWSNGRRFFDIMVLGVITPFALTAWIFDSYRHLFNQWWDNLKKLSLVQIYYAVFLLVLGWFIYGIPTPDTFTGVIIKLLVVVGGFARMSNPPNIISRHMNVGEGFDGIYSGLGKTANNIKKSSRIVKGVLSGPKGVAHAIWKNSMHPKVIAPTRMSKFHGK